MPESPASELPDEWFTELGKICNAFASLEAHLQLYYSMLAELYTEGKVWDQQKGLQEAARWPTAEVINRMIALLEKRVSNEEVRRKVVAVLEELRPAVRERNEFIHSVWTVAKVWKPRDNPAVADYSRSHPSRVQVRRLNAAEEIDTEWTLEDLIACQTRIHAGRKALVNAMQNIEAHLP